MGEVYKARDTRLDRSVAIKVLPSHLSGDSELRERLEREARAVSSLNHPHICTLHDVGREDGIDFLVMEHIEGETLAARLERGARPLSEALTLGFEIAGALGRAHRVGIVHRDLKPGNVMLTKSGPKLLDFGLAKLTGTSTSTPDLSSLSALPTEQKSLTAAGTVLGTFQYMAPEQLEGREIDARTDIFAFGAVVYEMLTGAKAFDGKTQASLISAIMTSEPPPISALAPMSPPSLEHVVKTCLAKDPEKRWQSAADVARELEWIAEGGTHAGAALSPTARGRERTAWGSIGHVAGILATALAGAIFFRQPPAPRLVTRFTLDLARGGSWLPAFVDVSPDSSHVAYVAADDAGQYLFPRRMGELEPTQIAGTTGAVSPFFSPDGQWVGFWADGKLQRVSVSGGLPVALCDTPPIRGASWGEDDVIVFGSITAVGLGLSSVPAGGGTPQTVTELRTEPGEGSHRIPDILPGGRAVVFTIVSNSGTSIALLMRESGEIRTLLEDAAGARYASTGTSCTPRGHSFWRYPSI